MSMQKSDAPGSYTEAVGTRLTPQTMRQFQEYKENHELQNSEALRRLVRTALETEEADTRIVQTDEVLERKPLQLAALLAALTWALVVYLGNPHLGSAVGGGFIVVILIWSYRNHLRI